MKRALRLGAVALVAFACAGSSCEKKAKDGGDDTSPPDVDSTVPANGEIASVSVVLSATFSEEMDLATITENTFRLSSGGTLVPGTVAAGTGDTVTFTPTAALLADVGYTAQILSEAADLAGNTLESAYSWSFTTTSGEFVLSSTALAPDSVFPTTYTCDGLEIVNPPLAWTAGPAGTSSYAIIFKDLSNSGHHWAIWDMPSTTLSLIQGIPNDPFPSPPRNGTMQNISDFGTVHGYYGPCPPVEHTYRFTLYAIDPATLPGLTTDSTGDEVEAVILQNDLGSATLTGTYAP